jgi:hypothetical protein
MRVVNNGTMSDEISRAWAAGLYEGEGSCGMGSRGYPRLLLGMTDRDVVERFREVLGFGSIHTPKPQAGRKQMHRFECGGWKNVAQAREWFGPYLFPRRLAQLDELLAKKPAPKPSSPPCAEPSQAGYRRHWRKGEPACEPCRAANTDAERKRLGMAPRYADGSGYE